MDVLSAVLWDFFVLTGVEEERGIRRGRSLRPRATKNVYLLMIAIILFA